MELNGLKHYLRVVTTPATPDVEIGPLSDDNYYDYGGAVGSQWGKNPAITLPTIGEEINVFAYNVLSSGDYILETSDALQIDAGTKLTIEDTAFRVVKYLHMVSSTRMQGVVVGASDYRNSYTFAESGTYFIVADSKILGTGTLQNRKKVAFAKSMLWTPGDPEVLTDTEIEEPIGFDTLQVYAKRGEFHGMSAQVSDSNLEFYGDAIDLIKSHYEADVDTWIGYIIKNSDSNNIYEGALDLSTYTEKDGEYASVSCKVGEVGPKTTLNNRTGNDINISDAKTVNGDKLIDSPHWRSIAVPVKHLVYTNIAKQKNDTDWMQTDWDDGDFHIYTLDTELVNEFGTLNSGQRTRTALPFGSSIAQFFEDSDFDIKFGQDTYLDVKGSLHFQIGVKQKTESYTRADAISATIYVLDKNGRTFATSDTIALWAYDGQPIEDINLTFSIKQVPTVNGLYIGILWRNLGAGAQAYVKSRLMNNSSIYMKMADNIADSPTDVDMLPIHDALNTIVEAISENALTVKSDYYAHKGSVVNPSGNTPGLGALKAITNGYKMRGIFQDENGERRNMPLSFKDAIESLNAIDCIGWGFSKENGQLYVRVERWDWFYNDTVLFSITGVRTITRRMAADDVITTLSIGYKKYATNEDYNSIDSIHGERDFLSAIKAVANEKSVKSEFIADNYAIEETRRARENVDPSEEFKYDENIFIFELVDIRDEQFGDENLAILSTLADVTNATGIARPTELINAKLSPRHCAARWRDFLFSANNRSNMKFGSGTINYNASFDVIPRYQSPQQSVSGKHVWSLQPYCEDEEYLQQSEKDDITYNHAKFKAEELEFEYPISTDQYNAILANPYGLIEVEGEPCWIRSFKYKLITGMAHFVLIPKYVEE